MAVRRQCNRYRTSPYGTDFNDVLKRAKRFYKDGIFYISQYGSTFTAHRPSIGFKDPENAIYFEKKDGKWFRQ